MSANDLVDGVSPVGLAGACTVMLRLPQGFFAPSTLKKRERAAVVAALGDDEQGADAVEAALRPLLRRRARPEATVAYVLLLASALWTGLGPMVLLLGDGELTDARFVALMVTLFSSLFFLFVWLAVLLMGDRARRSSMLPLRTEVLQNLNALRFARRPRGVFFRVSGMGGEHGSMDVAFADLVMEVAAVVPPSSDGGASMAGALDASLPSWASLAPKETLASRRLFLGDSRSAVSFRFFGTLFFKSRLPRTASLIAREDMGVTDGDMAAFIDGTEAIVRNHKTPGAFGSLIFASPLMVLLFAPLFPINRTFALVVTAVVYAIFLIAPLCGFVHAARCRSQAMVELRQLAHECSARHARARFHVDLPQFRRMALLHAFMAGPPTLTLSAKADADVDEDDTIIVTS